MSVVNGAQRTPRRNPSHRSSRIAAVALLVSVGLVGVLPVSASAASRPETSIVIGPGARPPSAIAVPTAPDSIQLSAKTIAVGRGKVGVTIRSSNVTLDGYRITGPQYSRYDGREIGILVAGTASAPLRNVTIRNCTITRFGYAAIVIRYVENFRIENCHIRNAVYAGIMVISGTTGLIQDNLVQRIGVVGYQTMNMNSYGIALTDAGGTVSRGISVISNTVEDVPQWHGIDTHGGRDIQIIANTIRRTNRAIFITTTTGGRRSADIVVSKNWMSQPTRRVDVRYRYPYNQFGITVYRADRVTGTLNGFDGWPRGNHLNVSGSTSVSIGSHRLYRPT